MLDEQKRHVRYVEVRPDPAHSRLEIICGWRVNCLETIDDIQLASLVNSSLAQGIIERCKRDVSNQVWNLVYGEVIDAIRNITRLPTNDANDLREALRDLLDNLQLEP